MRRRGLAGACVIALVSASWGATVSAAESARWYVPLRWSGDLAYDYRRDQAEGGDAVVQQLVALNLNASTFVWQPWFALLDGGLGVALSSADSDTDGSSGKVTTGHAKLLVLPQSRFPLDLHFERNDSRLSGELADTQYTDTRYGVVQSYRTPAGGTTLMGGYDHDIHDTADDGEDVSDFTRLELTHSLGNQALKLSGHRQKTEHRDSGREYAQDTVIARHTYRPSSSFNAESTASVIDTDDDTGAAHNTMRYVQLNSYAFWRPAKRPLTVTGGARYFALAADGGLTDTHSNSVNANAGINYRLSRRVRLTGSMTAARTSTAGQRLTSTTQSAGIAYQPDHIYFRGFQYSWNAAASMQNRTGLNDAGRSLGAQLGHSLQRSFAMGPGAILTASASEAISASFDSAAKTPHRLSHSATLAWQSSQGRRSTSMRLTASDSRTLGGHEVGGEIFQMVNFQLSSDSQLSRDSWLTGNLTIQTVRQVTHDTPDAGFDTSSGGSLVYRHTKAFGVRRLRFTSDLKLNADVAVPFPWARREEQHSVWENRLDYTIGRVDMRFSVRISDVKQIYHQTILFQIRRRFGG